MRASNGQIIARLGGAALTASVLLPWFKLDVQQIFSESFSLLDLDRNAAILLVAVGAFCVVQPKLGQPDQAAVAFMAVGGLATAAIVYKVFVAPPGSSELSELGIDGATLKELLKQLGITFNATIGAFVGIAGAAAVFAGAFTEYRAGGAARTEDIGGMSPETLAALTKSPAQSAPVELQPGQQRYVAPQPQVAYAAPPPQPDYAPPPQAAQPGQ